MYSPSAPPEQVLLALPAPPVSSQESALQESALQEETPLLININDNVNNVKKKEEDKNSCIICLEEKDDSNKSIISINEISFLNKSCSCHFFIHEKCFNLWFFKKPVCPICTLPLNYLEIIQISNSDRLEYIRFIKNTTFFLFFISFFSFLSMFLYYNIKN
jgi:hypothetical protein